MERGPARRPPGGRRGWPLTLELEVDGLGRVLVCHATPARTRPIYTRITPDDELRRALRGVDADVIVCGHTHMQYDRRSRAASRS